jgi:hypothetical protein
MSEYIAQMYMKVKGRPNYIVKKYIKSNVDIKGKNSEEVIYRSI